MSAVLQSAEYHGADTLMLCRVGGEAVAARQPGPARPEIGRALRLCFAPEAVHLFDAGSGLRLPHPGRPERRAA